MLQSSRMGRFAHLILYVLWFIRNRKFMKNANKTSAATEKKNPMNLANSKCINYADEVIWNLTYINVTQTNKEIKRNTQSTMHRLNSKPSFNSISSRHRNYSTLWTHTHTHYLTYKMSNNIYFIRNAVIIKSLCPLRMRLITL